MPKPLPATPNLEQLKKQAKELLTSVRNNDPTAVKRFREYSPRATAPTLGDAQLVIAREYGLPSWPKLKSHVEALSPPPIPSAQQALDEAMIRAANKPVNLARVKQLLDAGANIDGRLAAVGTNALGWAACGNRLEVIEFLLGQGADIHGNGPGGSSPLACAASRGHPDSVKLLLAHGANPNSTEPYDFSVMHCATFSGNEEVVKLLIEAGSRVNLHTGVGEHGAYWLNAPYCGETPLHYAMAYGSRGMIQVLLDAGADPNATTRHGETPFHWAGRHKRPKELVKWLQSLVFDLRPFICPW